MYLSTGGNYGISGGDSAEVTSPLSPQSLYVEGARPESSTQVADGRGSCMSSQMIDVARLIAAEVPGTGLVGFRGLCGRPLRRCVGADGIAALGKDPAGEGRTDRTLPRLPLTTTA